jgi:hypothetical protein
MQQMGHGTTDTYPSAACATGHARCVGPLSNLDIAHIREGPIATAHLQFILINHFAQFYSQMEEQLPKPVQAYLIPQPQTANNPMVMILSQYPPEDFQGQQGDSSPCKSYSLLTFSIDSVCV